ncbi:MAG: EF-hand domain-containing protein [Rickettsiales bacterium]
MKNFVAALTVLAVFTAPAIATANDDNMQAKADYYFKKIDTDGNGTISKQEHEAFGENMFNEADTNKDNQISKAELLAEKQKEKTEMKNNM